MHSFTCSKGFTFLHNSDFSGNVEIVRKPGAEPVKSFYVPASSLLEFVANYVMNEKIAELESATAKEILGIK